MIKKVIRKKIRKKYEPKMIYIRPDQNDYLLELSVKKYGKANKQSEAIRELIDFNMKMEVI